MWDHTCHPTQVNAPRPNPSLQAGTRDLPTPKGWKAQLTWATRQYTGLESNSRPLDHKTDALTTTLPSHP